MTKPLAVDAERLLADLKALSAFGALEGGGMDRAPFSPAYRQAADWLVGRMAEAGLKPSTDAAGNIGCRLGPAVGPAVLCGSHIDTVPAGGWLDGALGVVAALECARTLREARTPLARALEVWSFTDEEGSFVSLLGSRAMTGALAPEELDSASGRGGESAAAAMRRFGLDPERVADAARSPSDIAAYLELHIEQGPVLEEAGLAIGAVTAIVGIETVCYTFTGAARHAGTTPFAARRDALRGAATAIADVYDQMSCNAWGDPGFGVNFGAIEVAPGASNVVPGSARVTCEVRASTRARMADVGRLVRASFRQAADRLGLGLQSEPLSSDAPASMDQGMVEMILAASEELGLKSQRLPSGAGHDAQAFAAVAPAGMIFIPSRRGISHHPDEHSSDAQIVDGANVLLRMLEKLVTRA